MDRGQWPGHCFSRYFPGEVCLTNLTVAMSAVIPSVANMSFSCGHPHANLYNLEIKLQWIPNLNWCSMFHGSLLFALLFGVLARGPSGETNMPCFSGGSVHCWVPFYGWLLSASMICLHICKYHDLKLYVSRYVLPSLCYTVGMQWLFNGLHIIITSILMPTQWGPYPILTEHASEIKNHMISPFFHDSSMVTARCWLLFIAIQKSNLPVTAPGVPKSW